MEKQINILKRRRILDIIAIAAIIIIYAVLTFLLPENMKAEEGLSGFISGFQAGLGVVFVIFALRNIFNINRALKDEEKMKEMYVELTDERKLQIQKEVESATSSIFMVVLILGAITAGYFNSTVFMTILASLLVFASIRGFCKLYFSKKY